MASPTLETHSCLWEQTHRTHRKSEYASRSQLLYDCLLGLFQGSIPLHSAHVCIAVREDPLHLGGGNCNDVGGCSRVAASIPLRLGNSSGGCGRVLRCQLLLCLKDLWQGGLCGLQSGAQKLRTGGSALHIVHKQVSVLQFPL